MGDKGLGVQLRLFAHVFLVGESGCSGMWYCNDANKSQRIVVQNSNNGNDGAAAGRSLVPVCR